MAPPSVDHSYANCSPTAGRQSVPEPQQPSLFRHSTSPPHRRPAPTVIDKGKLAGTRDIAGFLHSSFLSARSFLVFDVYFLVSFLTVFF